MTVYLDYNATCPLRPVASRELASVMDALGSGALANPSSIHGAGRATRTVIERARQRVAAWAGVGASRLAFTSGATEGIAIALSSMVASGVNRLFIGASEHDAVRATAEKLVQAHGLTLEIIPVDAAGLLTLEHLETRLKSAEGRCGIAVQWINNETGVVQPVETVAALARAQGALFLCDGAQAFGKVEPGTAPAADFLVLSGHKGGAPAGVGALIVGEGQPVSALMSGGGQERGRRAGTENLLGIAAFGAVAAEEMSEQGAELRAQVKAQTQALETALRARVPEAVIFGETAPRIGNTVCLARPGKASDLQVIGLDLAGFAVSAGAACSSGKVARSHVLEAMGVSEALSACAIRVSLGWAAAPGEEEAFVDAWAGLWETGSRGRSWKATGSSTPAAHEQTASETADKAMPTAGRETSARSSATTHLH